MSWIIDSSLTYFQRLCVNVIKSGHVPKHIAFIMDGNRRFACKKNVEKVEGHEMGFEKLAETLQWCLELGVSEVTVYAFSIENFKRSKEEVDALINLARAKYKRLLEEKDRLMKDGICIRVIGNLSLLPDDIKKMIAEAMLMTKNNKKAILNVAFAYTARDEITSAIQTVVEGLQKQEIEENDVHEELLSKCLFSVSDPDILIRTSGEVRFSDFLLWQTRNTKICFDNVLWPEFNIWNLLACVLQYQLSYNKTEEIELKCKQPINCRTESFLKNLENRRWAQLESYAKS